jgi:heme/copper-type cytochrome/quinol oxidase subunit 1
VRGCSTVGAINFITAFFNMRGAWHDYAQDAAVRWAILVTVFLLLLSLPVRLDIIRPLFKSYRGTLPNSQKTLVGLVC